jgi:uncharacterized protein (UPF0333 family)
MIEALKDYKVIVLMIFIFCGFAVSYYGMNDVGARIVKNQNELYKTQNVVKPAEKEIVKEIVHDTVYIKTDGFSFNSKGMTVVEDNKRKPFMVQIDFFDLKAAYEIEGITNYKILCDGSLVDSELDGGISVKDCNGNWIFIVKGNRTFSGDN